MIRELVVKPDQDGVWHLHADDRSWRCAIGKNGVTADKTEGDGKSPSGTWRLMGGYYRADRMTRPQTLLDLQPIDERDGWCDDPARKEYNQAVRLPFSGSHEKMWRDDHLYDLVLVIDHNTNPIVPGNGSAVFLHIARPDYQGTEGCIALHPDHWLELLPELSSETKITIQI